ncbi:potassium channel family protein [Nakamurella sp. GG22]
MTDTSTAAHVITPEAPKRRRTQRRAELYRKWVAATTRPLDVLALVFLVDFLGERLVDNGPSWFQPWTTAVSLLIWLAFAVDYIVRLVLSPERWPFIRTHKLDLVMVLLPMLRVVRVVLLLRKSFRTISMEKIAGSLFTIVVVVVVSGAVLEWRVESGAPNANITSLGVAFWWAIVTTTTVGYGDTYPVTHIGRLIASVIMVVGIGLIGTVSATVAAWFVSRKEQARDDQAKADRAEARKQRRLRLKRAMSMSGAPAAEATDGQSVDAAPDAAAQTMTDARDDDAGDDDAGDDDADQHAGVASEDEMVDEVTSLSDTVAALTTQIQALTAQQEALRASIDRLVASRAG